MSMYEGAEAPDGVELYDFEDHGKSRELIQSAIKDTLESIFPREHNGVRMELSDVNYSDPNEYTYKEQKKILHNDGFLARRLRGTITLSDANTGEVLDRKENMTLMKVPWLTDRGTFIREGNEWGTISQQRLIPGAYSRYQKNGDLETQFNVRPGTGGAFRVNFNPSTAVYKMSIGGAEVHLYSLLHDLGVSDDELRARWGASVFEKNAESYDSRTLNKAYNKIVPSWDRDKNQDRTDAEKVELIRRALDRAQVAEAAVRKTLPSMFDREKAAGWRSANSFFEKAASMSKADMQDIASYINATSETKINVDAGKEELKSQIMQAISSSQEPGKETDPGSLLVRQMRMKRMIDRVNDVLKKNNLQPL